MKAIITLALLTLTIVSCTKENTAPPFTLHDLSLQLTGTYTGTRYCQSGSGINGYTYDTAYNVQLPVSFLSDSVLVIEGYELSFAGNLDAHNYYYYKPASGGGINALWDSTGHNLTFSFWSGGLGGGGGCTYVVSK